MTLKLRFFLLCLAVAAVCSCSAGEPPHQTCTNLVRRWSFGEEQRYKGPVKSVLLSEQVHEFESHFIYLHDKPIPKTMFEFDRSRRIVKETDYTVNGKPMAPKEYVYDENGFLVREYSISGIDGKPTLPTTYTYNEDGTNHEIRQTSDDGEVYSIWTFENDPESNYSEFVSTKSDGRLEMKVGIRRDERCRISEISLFPYGWIALGKVIPAYDENDNVISSVGYAPLGIPWEHRKYEYELDELGNWIKRSEFAWKTDKAGNADWKLMNEQFRKIEYYEQ